MVRSCRCEGRRIGVFSIFFVCFSTAEQIAINESKEHSQDDNIDALRLAEQECREAAETAQEVKLKLDVKLDELLRMAERIYK